MKKKCVQLFFIALSVLIFVSCGNEKSILYQSGVYDNKNWDDPVGTFQGDLIPDRESAIAVAEAIFTSSIQTKSTQNYIPVHVFYDEQDAVWIVCFMNPANKNTVGEDCNIALQKKDGKILRVWFGE